MKFRDGMWLIADDKYVEYAEDIYDIAEKKNGLSLLCPTRKIKSRGDTLNRSTITIVSLRLGHTNPSSLCMRLGRKLTICNRI